MSTEEAQPAAHAVAECVEVRDGRMGGLTIPPRYSTDAVVDSNRYRQLLAPKQGAALDSKSRVPVATSVDGSFRLLRSKGSLKEAEDALLLPSGLDVETTPDLAGAKGVRWLGDRPPRNPDEVLESLRGSFKFQADDPVSGVRGLRDPQLGAVHAVLGYWTTRAAAPATVVMPTGTGKTETMLALFASSRPKRLLVLVPSDALRDQIAQKFETFGVLQDFEVVSSRALRPVVGRVKHAFTSAPNAVDYALACNVAVCTPGALDASSPEIKAAFLSEFSHLFVDEAHHVPAATWDAIRREFDGRPIVQFTATPYREDGRHLGGRILYAFPLREAQRQGYYSKINYVSIFDLGDRDGALAARAVAQLRDDLANGYDHLLMARVKWIPRADDVHAIYSSIASDLNPVVIHSRSPRQSRESAIEAIRSRESRIIVCVDMLGEGFDLAPLKVAAIHDAHKSIGVTLQFVGRFARRTDDIGDATVVVSRPDVTYDDTLRRLYAEDADWNLLISDISEKAIGAQEDLGEFEAGFTSSPEEVSIRNLLPKMSTVVYRSDSPSWKHEGALDVFPEEQLLTWPVAFNPQERVMWFVTEEHAAVRWGDLKTVEEVVYHLYVLYWDPENRLLYINSSNNDSLHEELAKAVCGENVTRIMGESVFRVMAHVKRLVPTNVGVLDIRNRARRFSMYVGADVTTGFPATEAQTKTKTNIFAYGFEDGARVSIGASQKGRVWSYRVAGSLKEWVDWCNRVGKKLADASIDIDEVMADFIRPEAVEARPDLVPLALEWPPELFLNTSEEMKVEIDGGQSPLVDVELRLDAHTGTGPIPFSVASQDKSCKYELDFVNGAMSFRAVGSEAVVVSRWSRLPLSQFLGKSELIIYFEQDAMIVPTCILLKPHRELPPFKVENLIALDWSGIDLRKESQRATRDPASIQARMIEHTISSGTWDLVVDDDGSREVADVVALRIENEELFVRLIHCKYSSDDSPGARIEDFYAVCGQAQKSMSWNGHIGPMLRHLIRRGRNRRSKGAPSGIMHGSEKRLYEILDAAHGMRTHFSVAIAQPGLARSRVSEAILQLLASTEVYLHETALAEFTVFCSD